MYVMAALGVTGVIFGAARFFARGTPATMTKEYQEASNEYLKVCTSRETCSDSYASSVFTRNIDIKKRDANNTSHHRALTSSPSPVSHPPATAAPEWFRASPRASKRAIPHKSQERKKCSRISDRGRHAAFARIERRASVGLRIVNFLALDCSKESCWPGAMPCILRMLVSICHCTKIFADIENVLRGVNGDQQPCLQ